MDAPIVFQSGVFRRVTLPAGLHLLAVWTGQAASTARYLEAMATWRTTNTEAYRREIRGLADTAEQSVRAFETGNPDQILTTIQRYDRLLEAFSTEAGLNFYNDGHFRLRKRVELTNCAYKPSGAGGGDFGLAFSTDKNTLITLAENLERDKYLVFFPGDANP